MKTRLKLKRWATATIYLSLILIVFVSMVFISNKLDNYYGDSLNLSYILKDFIISLGDDVQEKKLKNYFGFKRIKNFRCSRK